MKPSQTQTLLLAASVCLTLAACGGGDESTTPITTPTAPTFAACFNVTPGVEYTMADVDEGGDSAGHHRVQMLKEPFEGVARSASVDLDEASGFRTSAVYWSEESQGIRFWGNLGYDNAGTVQTKTLHSDGFMLPLAAQAGQPNVVAYTDSTSYLSGAQAGQTVTASYQQTWTFEGFESLPLGGTTFKDTCRIKTASGPTDGVTTLWFAKGFGLIRARHTNSDGVMLEESSLETITAQP